MDMMEFFTWESLGTAAVAALAVGVLTQVTKSIPGVVKIPTQIWSYLLAAVILVLSLIFGEAEVTASGVVLALLNAAVVSLAVNGGYEAMTRKPPLE